MAYGDFKDFIRGAASEKIFRDKAFSIAKNSEYHWHQLGLASMASIFFLWIYFGAALKNENMSDLELAEELHKLIIRKFDKRKV